MKLTLLLGISVLSASLGCALAVAQEYARPLLPDGSQAGASGSVDPASDPVPLEWTPPALTELSLQATVKNSFTLDRTLLGVAAGMVPDSDEPTRHAINRLDGVSVHLLRFGASGIADEREVEAIRDSYHLRGWKHLVTSSGHSGKFHSGTTDVWFVLDGINVRGAVVLAETPKSLTLITVAGNLSPIDVLHLRGHFGIPRLDVDDFKEAPGK
jgi:hypothetical protein